MTEQLCFPNRVHLINCFQFTDNEILNQNIKAQSFIKGHSIIYNWKINLSEKSKSAFFQFMTETDFVYSFKQTRP